MKTSGCVHGFPGEGGRARRPMGTLTRLLVAALAALVLAAPRAALAIDPPNWVAALHVAAQGAVGLRWTPVAGATGYKVLRSTTAGSGHAEIASVTVPQHFDKDVQPGTTYYYVLQSVAGAEVSGSSQERSVAIPGEKKVEAMKPPVLQDPTLSQSSEFGKVTSKVGLRWDPVSGAIAYNLYRSTTPGKDHQMLTSVSETTYADATVEVGKTYYYAVSAIDQSFQETPRSAEKSLLVKEPEKRVAAVKKEKIKIMLRASRPVFEIKEGEWGKLVQPAGVAIHPSGEIYVTDSTQGRVFVFSSTGEFRFAFGEGELNNPGSIAINADGDVLVAHNAPNLKLFSEDGRLRKVIDHETIMPKVPKDLRGVAGVTPAADDGWYLSNPRNHEVYLLDDAFKLVETLGSKGGELNQFTMPVGLSQDSKDGALLVADGFNFQVKIWKGGEAIGSFGSYGNSVGQFSRLVDVAATEAGEVLALDFLNATVQCFDREGNFKWVLGVEAMDGQVQFGTPASFAIKGKRLYVAQVLAGKLTALDLLDEVGAPKLKKK